MSSSATSSSSSDESERSTSSRCKKPLLKRRRSDEAGASSDDDSDTGSNNAREIPDALALSHAERRRQKKKEGRSQKEVVNAPAAKKRKLKDGVAVSSSISKKEKRQNSVWVGNLSFKTTPDALRGFFDGVGDITRIHMPMRAGAKGENMGSVVLLLDYVSRLCDLIHRFAYVDFGSPDHKIIAITLSERDFHGRRLLIKDGMFK